MRIVSLVPSHTESLHALGAADDVVGRTRFCVAPRPWVDGIPSVGGTKDARLEKILALAPDLVVADKDENPKALVDALLEHGIDVVWSEIDSVADAAGFLVRLGGLVGREHEGKRLAEEIHAAVADVRGAGGGAPVFVPIWHDPWMTFDRTAYPHAMLDAVGLRNVFASHAGPKYFEVSAEEVRHSGAQWCLLPTEPYPFHRRRDSVDTGVLGACGASEQVLIIDGEALTWFGARTAPGIRALAETARRLAGRSEAGTPA